MYGQAILENMAVTTEELDAQVAISRGAVGNLSATKATNELLAMQTTQVMELQQMQAMNHRVLTSQLLQQTALNDMERMHLEYLTFAFAPEELPGPVFTSLPR
jgi:conjugal transfer/entry exclusion protein